MRRCRGVLSVATVCGRYFAMDRDHRWERTRKAFDAIVHAIGSTTAKSADEAIRASYEAGVTDEFIEPAIILDDNGRAHTFGPADEVIFWNFRSDRGRQLTEALVVDDFKAFDRGDYTPHTVTTMTTYDETLPANEWQRFEMTFTTRDEFRATNVYLYCTNVDARAWFDGIELRPVE